MSQVFVYRCIILVVIALMLLRDRIVYDVDSTSIDQPTWQMDDEAEDLFNSCSWNATRLGSQQSLIVTVDPSYYGGSNRDHFQQFLKIISRFDCRDEKRYRYSMIWKCHDCKVSNKNNLIHHHVFTIYLFRK